jgi:hypothetical protein
MMSNLITQDQRPQVITTSPMALLSTAVHNGANIETLERLMDLQERWQATQAKQAFNRALSEFQANCPRIEKRKQAHNYKYAPLGDIAEQLRSTLHKVGLTYRFEQQHLDKSIRITCVVTHVDGHAERTSMEMLADTSGSKNAIQAIGSAVTYGQRYTLIGALGITTADEDIDGRLPDEFKHKDPYINFKADREKIEQSIKGGRPADDVIEQLERTYKVTETVKQAILAMEK